MDYNQPGTPWSLQPGPPMPNAVTDESGIPAEVLAELDTAKASDTFKTSLVAGPITRLMMPILTLFGISDLYTMWREKDGKWSPLSPQLVTAIPPAQAVFTIVGLDTADPRIMLIKRTRDLAAHPKYTMPFWLRGLTPSVNALRRFMGIATIEFPRGALADGKGFKAPKEAEEELGLKTEFFIHAGAANVDPGQFMASLPHMIAIMGTEKTLVDEVEKETFRGYDFVVPEELITSLRTQDGVSLSQVITAIQAVLDLNENTQIFDGNGMPIQLPAERLVALRSVFARILRGPLEQIIADMRLAAKKK